MHACAQNNIPTAGSSVVSSLSLSCFKGADVLYKTQFIDACMKTSLHVYRPHACI